MKVGQGMIGEVIIDKKVRSIEPYLKTESMLPLKSVTNRNWHHFKEEL